MNETQITFGAATLLGAVGLWLMLPRGSHRGRWLGVLCALGSLGLFGYLAPRMYLAEESTAALAGELVFMLLAVVTIVSAAATISMRNPVYSAIWFAMSLLGTSGLFLYQGAQFLAVATIVVYAGAILVTFLFVLMLAQPKGHAYYDRLSWEALLSAGTGAVLVGVLTMAIDSSMKSDESRPKSAAAEQSTDQAPVVLAEQHVAHLGAQLFSKYLIAVEVVGTLLLVALVGAVAIVSGDRKPSDRPKGAGHA
ncbi:MAG: NADH-quinone oxidoreductase subunit J [Planctomycetes bacterium]|nr:NADH-quinone oxidoreductase subunit J [Planctomycetota bacterium]